MSMVTGFWNPYITSTQIIGTTTERNAASPLEGQQWYDTTLNQPYWWNGSAWVPGPPDNWTAFTPSLTPWVLNNGTLTGAYAKVGRTVNFKLELTVGSTTTFGTGVVFTGLPFTSDASWWGTGMTLDTSAGVWAPCLWNTGASTNITPYALTSVNQMNNGGMTTTVPFTWAVGDYIYLAGAYRATT